MPTFVVGQDSNTGGALAGPVGRASVDLASTWVTSPGDLNATYGSGYLLNATTRGQVTTLYSYGMQQAIIVDLSGYPLYALSSQFQTDIANVVANFDAGGPPYTNLYVVLHNGIESYNATGVRAYLPSPLGGTYAPTVAGSTGAWTLRLSYQSSGGSAFPGTPVVAIGDNIYLDEVIGVTGLDTTVTPNLPTDLVGPYVVQASPAPANTTTGGVTTTSFTILIGAIMPLVLDTSTSDPSGPGPVFGGRMKVDSTQAVAHGAPGIIGSTGTGTGFTNNAAYQTALAGVLSSTKSAITGASARTSVGVGLTGMRWVSGSVGIGSSVWNTALSAMNFIGANLINDYTQEPAMVTALGNATAELYSVYGKPFMLTSFDITEPAGTTVVHNTAHYTNLTSAFTTFTNSVFTNSSMTTLTGNGLFAINFYNDDYLNTQNVGSSYSDLITKTNQYAQPQHFYNVKSQPATARILVNPSLAQPAGAQILAAVTRAPQPATGRILATPRPTQPATAAVSVTPTPVQPAAARIATLITRAAQPTGARLIVTPTPAQPATARILLTVTRTPQPATSTLIIIPITFQPATGRILASSSAPPQPAGARISLAITGPTQPATARIGFTPTPAQPAGARLSLVRTLPQSATARIGFTPTPAQSAGAQILARASNRINAGSTITNGYTGTVTPIGSVFTPPDRQPSFIIYPVQTLGDLMADPLCIPDSYEMGITEDLVLPFDPTPLLSAGQTAMYPSATLLNQDTQQLVSLVNAPAIQTLAGGPTVIVQRIVGGRDLATTGRYRLEVTFTATPSTNVFTIPLDLVVVR